MSKKCFDDFTRTTGRTLDDAEKEKLLGQVDSFRKDQAMVGQSDTDINPDGLTNLQKQVKRIDEVETSANTEDVLTTLRQLDSQERLSETILNVERNLTKYYESRTDLKKKPTPEEIRERAFIGTLVNTNDTRGTSPMELMLRSEQNSMFGDLTNKIKNILDEGETFEELVEIPEFKKDFWSEYYNVVQNPTTVKAGTGNKKAFDLAKAYFEETSLTSQTKLSLAGKTMRLTTLGNKVRFQHALVKKMKEQEFMDYLAPRLSEAKHGTIAERRIIAQNIHKKMSKGTGESDWRTLGEKRLKDETDNNPLAKNEREQLVYRDGTAFTEVNTKFSDNATSKQLIEQHTRELAREVTLTRFLGPNHQRGLDALKKRMERGDPSKGIKGFGNRFEGGEYNGRVMRSVFSWLENQVNPSVHENSKFVQRLAGLRGFMAGSKLGSAVITALMDLPIFVHAGRRLFGVDASRTMASWFDGEGSKRNMRYVLEMKESWLDSATERFGLIDGTDSQTGFQKGGSGFANLIFKYSGLNWWTRSLQAKAAGAYSLNIGDLISSRTDWDNISKPVKQNFEKFGLDKKDWADLLRDQPLDVDGRLDLFQIQDRQHQVTFGKQSTRDKLIATMADAVDTMVMKPGQFDILTTKFFSDNKIGQQVGSTITQFKSHPISFWRKIAVRDWKSAPKEEAIANLMMLAAMTTVSSAAVLQLKQVIAGKNPYRIDDGEFMTRALIQGGSFGIMSDIFFSNGGDQLIEQLFTPDSKVRRSTALEILGNQLGPTIIDAAKLLDAVFLQAGGGLVLQAQGQDRNYETTKKGLYKITRMAIGQSGLENLWITKLLVRKWLSEHLHEMIDPKGYRRREKRIRKEARKKRYGGSYNNLIFDKLPTNTLLN